MKEKTVTLNKARDVTLSPYLVHGDKKPVFIILPGGAYRNCEESEGIPVAKALNSQGYSAFILRYSVGKHYKWPYPLEDFDRAMEHITVNAGDYGVDPGYIVVAGFSAGGHVAAMAASQAVHKPYAAVLCYGLAVGETLNYCAPDAPDASEMVNMDTRPCFIASSRNDWIVPIYNTTRMIEAFQKNFIDYEAHIYGYSLHGFSVGEGSGAVGPLFCSRVGNWVSDCLQWLDEMIGGRYKSIRECAEYNDAFASCFSTMNSCHAITANDQVFSVFRHRFPVQFLMYTAAKKQIGDFLDSVSLRNLLEITKTSEKTIVKIDEALSCFVIERDK